MPSGHDASRVVDSNGLAPTVKENHGTVTAILEESRMPTLTRLVSNEKIIESCRIRKLTPKECFRLMGFDDRDVDVLVENGISNSQIYKMAGNSIVVDVIESIFESLFFKKKGKEPDLFTLAEESCDEEER